MRITKYIPNTLTCLNLFFGCTAIVAAFEFNYLLAALFVMIAAVLDFSDGFAARIFNAYSAIGKELDSLADMVSFGIAPSVVVFSMMKEQMALHEMSGILPYIAFLLSVFSALRLAKFNIDDRQTTSFIGMPTPANALFWVSLAVYNENNPDNILSPGVLAVLVVVFSMLLVAEIPMFSLKIKELSIRKNLAQVILILSAAVLVFSFGFLGVSLTILFYLLSSVMLNILKR